MTRGLGVGVTLGVRVAVGLGVGVPAGVGVAVAVAVGVDVGVGVGVGACWCWTRLRTVPFPPVLSLVGAPTPDDHFAAGPDCRVIVSADGRVGGAGGRPTVGAGIVSPAGVQDSCRR